MAWWSQNSGRYLGHPHVDHSLILKPCVVLLRNRNRVGIAQVVQGNSGSFSGSPGCDCRNHRHTLSDRSDGHRNTDRTRRNNCDEQRRKHGCSSSAEVLGDGHAQALGAGREHFRIETWENRVVPLIQNSPHIKSEVTIANDML